MRPPTETTYALAKFWPFLGGFGVLLAIVLPRPLAIAWIVLVPIVSSIIVIRGAYAQPIDMELVHDRRGNPPRFSLGFYLFAACLPFASFPLLAISVKAFVAAFAFLSLFSTIFFGVLDFSTKRVILSSLPSILMSFVLLYQYWGFPGVLTYSIMLVIMLPKAIEVSIENQKLLIELQKANNSQERSE